MAESMIEALTNATAGAVIQAVLEASWGPAGAGTGVLAGSMMRTLTGADRK